MRGAVTLVVRGRVYPSRDRPFHESAMVGGGRLRALLDVYNSSREPSSGEGFPAVLSTKAGPRDQPHLHSQQDEPLVVDRRSLLTEGRARA